MTKIQFLYNFTNIFLKEAVKETILIENWVETKDFDPRYEEYAKFFLTMKKKFLSQKYSDKEITDTLTESKNKVVFQFNKKFSNLFRKEVMKRGCTIEIADQLISKNISFDDNNIDENALKKFRELEEKISNANQGET
jgi:6-pyruvoyl-tetrahydropterin synthase